MQLAKEMAATSRSTTLQSNHLTKLDRFTTVNNVTTLNPLDYTQSLNLQHAKPQTLRRQQVLVTLMSVAVLAYTIHIFFVQLPKDSADLTVFDVRSRVDVRPHQPLTLNNHL